MFAKLFIIATLFNCLISERNSQYDQAIRKSVDYIEQIRKDYSVPGIVGGVSINGSIVWAQGFWSNRYREQCEDN